MDPLTQGLLGAALPQAVVKKPHLIVAGGLGLLSAMAPDLDVLIRSSNDPLLFLDYHRQFTHSLLFIPFGSFLCALVLHQLIAKRFGLSFKQSWIYCMLGYGTHALLDAFTSYGTQLFWPLNDIRYAWNAVSVVDPILTLPLLILLLVATLRRKALLARLAIIWVVIYLTLGMVQRDRAEQAGWQLAQERKHTPTRLVVKPTFANILLWKVIYETQDEYYVDAVRVGTSIISYSGDSIARLDVSREFPWLESNSQQAKDIERFSRFSDGFLARDPTDKRRIIDVRYSMLPNQIDPLWSIQLSPSANVSEHVSYATHRNNIPAARQRFKNMLLGKAL